jgi:hypothetical protein
MLTSQELSNPSVTPPASLGIQQVESIYLEGPPASDDDHQEEAFAINLDEVSQQLGIPVETLNEQLQRSSSWAPLSGGSTPEQSPRLGPSISDSQFNLGDRVSTLRHSLRASSSTALCPDDAMRSREVSFVSQKNDRGSSFVLRDGPRLSSLSLPSPRIASQLSPQRSTAAREQAPLLASPSTAASTRERRAPKRVHFPENVVKSVCIIPGNDGHTPILRVKYNRPWYAYVVFLASNVFFVLAWTEIMKAAWPSTWPGESLSSAVSIVAFIAFAFATTFLLFYLLLTWRPLTGELLVLRSRWFMRSFIKTMIYGIFSQTLLTVSCMLHITCVNTISFTTVPLIMTFLYEKVQHRAMTSMDTFGTAAAAIGMIVLCVGEERADVGDRMHRFGAIVASVLGGVCMAPYLSQLRTVSKDVSNAFVITASVLLSTLVAAAVAAAAGGYTAPLGNGDDRRSVFSDLSRTEFLRVMLSGAFMFFFWFLHHKVSLYFDQMSIVAGYSLCSPIVLVIYKIQSLPTMEHMFEGIGGALVTLGCSTVVFSGWYYRTYVAIRIEVER